MKLKNKIRFMVMDVDGTLTDGKIYMSNHGETVKVFNVKDGYGIHDILIPLGIVPIILTGRKSDIITSRCEELGIQYLYQEISDKRAKLHEVLNEISIKMDIDFEYSMLSYIGDDINDLPCMELIKGAGGVIGCPSDAVKEIRNVADFISNHSGGDGAVRDFIEWLQILKLI